jgi:glycosyltransferase involved in cell wall biosynthesis
LHIAATSPRIHYGSTPVPTADEVCLGGRVKLQRLHPFFPDAGPDCDILYLVSSALPDAWLPTYWRARRHGRRVVWNQSAVSYPAVWPDLDCEEDNLLLEQGLHAADFVIYQSDFSRQVADRYLGRFSGPSAVVHNAVDTRIFAPRPDRPRRPGFTILLGGTQYRRSSVEIALTAFAEFRKRAPQARLLIAGALCWTSDRAAAAEAADMLAVRLGIADGVEFIGEYTQALATTLYARADVLLHTRYDDLCPNVVIEALACGLPVVYSRTGGTPELVGNSAGIGVEHDHSWETECFAPAEAWADALDRIAADHDRFRRAARQWAVERFGLEDWIAAHREIFAQVASTPQRPLPSRVPASARLKAPLQLLAVNPPRLRQHEAFNPQPDGSSAFTLKAANASYATMLVVDDNVQHTDFTNPSTLSAAVAADLTSRAGVRTLRLEELVRVSNDVHIVVDPAIVPQHHSVSVIITCYNHARFLGDAIESALAQSYPPAEVVVVDDGSTDDTALVCARYSVRYVHQRNAGLSAARNRGLLHAASDFIVFLDADDVLHPAALQRGLECFAAHPDAGLVFGRYRHVAEDGTEIEPPPPPVDAPDLYLALLHYNHIGMHGAVMYRRRVFDDIGVFDTSLNAAEDYDMYLRTARRFPVRRHDHVVADYRKYGTSMSDSSLLMLQAITELLERESAFIDPGSPHAAALRQGLHGNRAHYLKKLRAQRGRVRGWRRLRAHATLLRWDPGGLLKDVSPAFHARLLTARDAVVNLAAQARGRGRSTGTIRALPNPVTVPTGSMDMRASTTLSWNSTGATALEVRVHAPDGPLFSTGAPDSLAETGLWVVDGTRFFLQDVSEGSAPGRTLSVVTIRVLAK